MSRGCEMHGMAHGRCALCDHASTHGVRTAFSAPDTPCGQICQSALWLLQNGADHQIKPLVAPASFDALAAAVLEAEYLVPFGTTRSTNSIPPFDPLISSLRI